MKPFTPEMRVLCPEDRGGPAEICSVVKAIDGTQKNHQGQEFQWILVETHGSPQTKHMWPSNRLKQLAQ